MTDKRIISGNAETIFEQVNHDIAQYGSNNYHVELETEIGTVEVNIVSSPGGNNEGGYEQTILLAELWGQNTFRFAIFPEDFLNKIGKFFGVQDVILGYPEFDKRVIIQTNDEVKLKALFENASTRALFENMSGYSFHIDKHKQKEGDHLHLVIQRAVSNTDLQNILGVFLQVLGTLNHSQNATGSVTTVYEPINADHATNTYNGNGDA